MRGARANCHSSCLLSNFLHVKYVRALHENITFQHLKPEIGHFYQTVIKTSRFTVDSAA